MNNLDLPLADFIKTTKDRLRILQELGVRTLRDLFFYFPWRYSDETETTRVIDLVEEEMQSVTGEVSGFTSMQTKTGKLMTRAFLRDETGKLELVWFNQPYLRQVLTNGVVIIASGKPKLSRGKITMLSPKFELVKANKETVHTGRVVPVYHSASTLTPKWFREKIFPLLYLTKQIKDYIGEATLRELNLIGLSEAVAEAHFPSDEEKLAAAKRRLAFDELFLLQLGALRRKWYFRNLAMGNQKEYLLNKNLVQEFLANLPFALTNAQGKVIAEILEDLQKPYPMSRLLEGDVGSGKTVVAAASLLAVISAGYQGLIMAPTEILARQHYQNLFKYLQKYGVTPVFLAGSLTKTEKERVYERLRLGTADLVVGTHALLQEKVQFKNLGLAIVDEQHRFGVKQREILKSFGTPHLLSLTATPIPRTLALTIYGDQEVSILDELPAGRSEIVTRVVPESKRDDAYVWIETQVKAGRQAFVVCPLIQESEELQLKSVIAEYERLNSEVFPDLVLGLLHGKMKQKEKDAVMEKFANNEIQILVSTTVVEVGIDVPNATIMVIEGADRFGLAQLHQLRGRVGRGEHQSYCFLFPEGRGEEVRQRMQAMTEFSDGFRLAEIDLELRGPGEVYGVKQSGIPDLKMASFNDKELIGMARALATKVIDVDPELKSNPHLLDRLANLDREFGVDY